ncbi:MAG TPA: DPP IV N-terminal domain-containing protein [Candidatus Polarisedimenticolaceae bacterium]|nr:DPP IV N-terminal domain-containing protein [Candidatus Polarisedimenticolaceae bacterium]
MLRRTVVGVSLGACLLGAVPRAAEPEIDLAAASARFFKDLAETRSYTLGKPVSVAPTPDGKAVLFLRGGPRDPVLRLYELNVASGQTIELLAPETVLQGGTEQLSVEERARRERQRMSLRGFTAFEMSVDGARLLLTLSGKLYVVRRADRSWSELPGEGWIDPHFSPDGRLVGAVRGGELHVIDVAARSDRQVTTGATETLTHGTAEFVAQEEMNRFSGYWWSPDSTRLAFQETDVAPVQKLYIPYPDHPEQAPEGYFYPRAGTANARVRLGLVGAQGGAPAWIAWDGEKYPYLARVVWKDAAPLTLLVQTRDQREEKLLAVDPRSGTTRELLTETDEAWLNLDDGGMPRWLPAGSAFLWTTERRGDWQLELRGPQGALIRELTPPGFHLAALVDVDPHGRVAVVAGGDARERQLYRLSLDGGTPVPLTREPGFHRATFSKDYSVWAHDYTLADGQSGVELRRTGDGHVLAQLPSVAESPPRIPQLELVKVGERQFDALLLRPRDFQRGRKYPVLVSVYAGPTAKVVIRDPRRFFKEQWMADHGYVVVSVDGRGTPGRGRAWERAIVGNLIDIALEDQVAGLKALAEKYPELDLTHVGITGWSFGGYFTAMAVARRPDVYHVGVAGAPVTDWALYDTHYTERYLGLPSANTEGYRKSSVLTYADKLERPLLLIHGFTDDNVYFVNTLELADALFRAGRPYDLLTLGGTHMVSDPAVRLRLETRVIDYISGHLGLPVRYTRGAAAAPSPN